MQRAPGRGITGASTTPLQRPPPTSLTTPHLMSAGHRSRGLLAQSAATAPPAAPPALLPPAAVPAPPGVCHALLAMAPLRRSWSRLWLRASLSSSTYVQDRAVHACMGVRGSSQRAVHAFVRCGW